MTAKVVPLRTLPTHQPRSRDDRILELEYSASYFATAIRMYDEGMLIPEDVIAEAEAFLKFSRPVRRYQGGQPAPPENTGGEVS